MPGIYAGDTKCLVFPVMCDGYLKLDYYGKNSADTELALRHGLWGHQGKFSIEAVITPYDVNGYGTKAGASGIGYATSEKTPPSLDQTNNVTDLHYQSENYFTHTARKTHKMYLFHNPNFGLYLENTTLNNLNQPAEYKIVANVGGTLVSSNTVIKAHNTLYGKYDENGLYEGANTSLTLLDDSSVDNSNTSMIELDTASNVNKVGVGTELFNSAGTTIGTVNTIDASAGTLVMSQTQTSGNVYYSQPKEALYMETLYKVGFSYSGGNVNLYLNNKLVKTSTVTAKEFEPANCYIGNKVSQTWSSGTYGSGAAPSESSVKSTQFMGELYEICMYKRTEPTFSIHTLSPGYDDIIFYSRFGDE